MQETIRDVGSTDGSGRSPAEGHGNSLQYYCLKNPMDRGAWWTSVHRVAKCQTRLKQLSMHTLLLLLTSSLQIFINYQEKPRYQLEDLNIPYIEMNCSRFLESVQSRVRIHVPPIYIGTTIWDYYCVSHEIQI